MSTSPPASRKFPIPRPNSGRKYFRNLVGWCSGVIFFENLAWKVVWSTVFMFYCFNLDGNRSKCGLDSRLQAVRSLLTIDNVSQVYLGCSIKGSLINYKIKGVIRRWKNHRFHSNKFQMNEKPDLYKYYIYTIFYKILFYIKFFSQFIGNTITFKSKLELNPSNIINTKI